MFGRSGPKSLRRASEAFVRLEPDVSPGAAEKRIVSFLEVARVGRVPDCSFEVVMVTFSLNEEVSYAHSDCFSCLSRNLRSRVMTMIGVLALTFLDRV